MISIVLAGHMALALMQAGVDAPRKAFSTCLKDASAKALDAKVAAPEFKAFVTARCASPAAALRDGLVSFDVKHGVKRGQATTDAQAQIDDYLLMAGENYEARAKR